MKKKFKKLMSACLAVILLFSTVLAVPPSAVAGSLVWPVPGHTNLSQGLHNGNAIDICDGGIYGATVVAAMGGTVEYIFLCGANHYRSDGDCNGFGTGLVIKGDDGRTYQYAHMLGGSIPENVYRGAYVSAGQKIGQVGNTGNSSGAHLHFGISYGDYWNPSGINPEEETYVSSVQSLVTPTITTNKSEYALGESVDISWTPSPANSNLSHYWLIIDSPSGNTILNQRMDYNTSYSFIVSEAGEYRITTFATPIGSQAGEGSLTDTKTIKASQRPGKPVLNVEAGTSNTRTVFSWNSTSDISLYLLTVKNTDTGEQNTKELSNNFSEYDMLLIPGNYEAVIKAYSSGGSVCSASNTVNFTVLQSTEPDKDGWIFSTNLPSDVSAKDYTINYKHTYTRVSADSPGEGWVRGALNKSEYQNVGEPYWSNIELETSESRVLLSYHYYHFCSGNTGTEVNYEFTDKFPHYDALDPNGVYSFQTGYDSADNRYKYYYLNWNDGNRAYCSSGVTCDGSYGNHSARSFVWYKTSQYQDRAKVDYYNYSKTSDWTETLDETASSVVYRYKLNNSDPTQSEKLGDVNGDSKVNVKDATMIQKSAASIITLSNEQSKAADVNKDGKVNVTDATAIQKYSAGIETGFDIGK